MNNSKRRKKIVSISVEPEVAQLLSWLSEDKNIQYGKAMESAFCRWLAEEKPAFLKEYLFLLSEEKREDFILLLDKLIQRPS